MERISVQSSNIASIGYDATTEILEVEFLDGSVYEYRNIPEIIYNELMSASSHGTYLNANIKGRYSYEKIG